MTLDKTFFLNALAISLAAIVVLARLFVPNVSDGAAGLAMSFVTGCFAAINRGTSQANPTPQNPTPPQTGA